MIRADSDKCALHITSSRRDDERSTAESIAAVSRSVGINAGRTTKAAGNQVNVAIAGADKIIDGHPFLVFAASAGCTVDWCQPCGAVVGGAENLDRADAESQRRKIDAAGGTIAGQHRIAGVTASTGGQQTAIG